MEDKKNRVNKKKPIDKTVSSSNSDEGKIYSVQEVVEAWKSFKPKVPFSYTLASHAAARLKNGQ